jgi:hypothetical protein
MNAKDEIITSLQAAQAELEKALGNLAQRQAFDTNRVQFAAHTLTNYLTVIEGDNREAKRGELA